MEDAQKLLPNPACPSAASASSEDRLIKEFTRQEPCKEESQETLAEEGDEGSGAPGSGACVGVLL